MYFDKRYWDLRTVLWHVRNLFYDRLRVTVVIEVMVVVVVMCVVGLGKIIYIVSS